MSSDPKPVTLDEMILHDDVLDRYPWMSGHILQRWRRENLVRSFRGKEGAIVYPKEDLARAITIEMERTIGDRQNILPGDQHTRQERCDSSEAKEIRERLSYESIFGREQVEAAHTMAVGNPNREKLHPKRAASRRGGASDDPRSSVKE